MSKTKEKNTTEVLSISDEKFDVDQLEKYYLSLTVAENSLKTCVLHAKDNRILWFDHITWNEDISSTKALDEVYENHRFLSAGFWKRIMVVHENPYSTIVPSNYFNEKKVKVLLESVFGPLDSCYEARSKKHQNLKFNSVYASNEDLNNYFKNKYPNKQLVYSHSSDGIIDFANEGISSSGGPELWLNLTGQNLKAMLLKKGSLEFFNCFECLSEEDLSFFSATLIQQLNLDVNKLSLILSGDSISEKNTLEFLKTYFPNIRHANRPKPFYFGYRFDDIPAFHHLESFSSFFAIK